MQAAIRETTNLSVIEGEADELIVSGGRVPASELADGHSCRRGGCHHHRDLPARLIHLGEKMAGRRAVRGPGDGLSKSFERVGLRWAAENRHSAKARMAARSTVGGGNAARRRSAGAVFRR